MIILLCPIGNRQSYKAADSLCVGQRSSMKVSRLLDMSMVSSARIRRTEVRKDPTVRPVKMCVRSVSALRCDEKAAKRNETWLMLKTWSCVQMNWARSRKQKAPKSFGPPDVISYQPLPAPRLYPKKGPLGNNIQRPFSERTHRLQVRWPHHRNTRRFARPPGALPTVRTKVGIARYRTPVRTLNACG
jgi:hypothetical protein